MSSDFIAGLHPEIVHFPVALLSTYVVLEIIGLVFNKSFFSNNALLLLCFGVVSAFFAVISGNEAFSAFQNWTEDSKKLLAEHQNYATILLWFSLFVCAARLFLVIKKKFTGLKKFIFIPLALIVLFLVYETGRHGGKLVSKFGVGTELIIKE